MRFGYSFKTSDGIRRESVFEAKTKEEVFASLREQGIKPIKVWELHSRFHVPWYAVAIAVLALSLLSALVHIMLPGADEGHVDSDAMVELRVMASAIADRHKAELVLAADDGTRISEVVERTREDARQVFKDIMIDISDPAEQLEAKRLYGELMLLTDVSQEVP